MNKTLNLILILSFFIFSTCKTQKGFSVNQCSSYRIKTDKQITWSKLLFNDKEYHQARYCTHHPSVLSQLLFDEFGHWSDTYIDKDKKSIITLWKNKKINGIDKKFTLGTTSYHDLLSSIVVYDENHNDMLAPDSKYREILLKNFRDRINNYDTKKKSLYRQNWRNEIVPLYRKHFNW